MNGASPGQAGQWQGGPRCRQTPVGKGSPETGPPRGKSPKLREASNPNKGALSLQEVPSAPDLAPPRTSLGSRQPCSELLSRKPWLGRRGTRKVPKQWQVKAARSGQACAPQTDGASGSRPEGPADIATPGSRRHDGQHRHGENQRSPAGSPRRTAGSEFCANLSMRYSTHMQVRQTRVQALWVCERNAE